MDKWTDQEIEALLHQGNFEERTNDKEDRETIVLLNDQIFITHYVPNGTRSIKETDLGKRIREYLLAKWGEFCTSSSGNRYDFLEQFESRRKLPYIVVEPFHDTLDGGFTITQSIHRLQQLTQPQTPQSDRPN